jgi:hypothetical protein
VSIDRTDREEIPSGRKAEPALSPPIGRAVARKAVAFSLGESLASSSIGEQLAGAGEHGGGEHGEQAVGPGARGADGKRGATDDKPASAVETAEDGFRGTPSELPYRAELEKSFGVSFAGVKAYTDEHARRATTRLGAKAYAAGNRIAFAMPTPAKALVAHELTHVLQHTGRGPSKQIAGGGGDGIDVSGEAEAERVEAAVGAQGSAQAALHGPGAEPGREPNGQPNGQTDGHAAHGDAAGHDHAGATHDAAQEGEAHGASPALARRPALAKSAFGAGMTFSRYGFEKSSTYTLWKKTPAIRVPIGAVPGLNLVVDPSVQVRVAAGADLKKKGARASLGVLGSVGVGFAYGIPDVAEIYAKASAGVHGGFVFQSSQKAGDWNFDGGFTLTTDLSIGAKLGGVLDTKFTLGKLEVGTLSKLHWGNDGFKPEGLGWTWGDKLNGFFGTLRTMIDKAKEIMKLKDGAGKAWKKLGGAVGDVGGFVKHIDLNPFN